ncbi:MAG: rhamnulokinase [Kiritimatiellaeota bacterium]|nr:rhamnulokinase [Kiritimatiellota bacterium]
MKTFLSIDLGAGSGRVIAMRYDGAKLISETVNRFDNSPVELSGHIYWNIPALITSIREGLVAAHRKYGEIASVGVDTWGVDYAFLDKSGRILGLPYAYRDSRHNAENTERAFAKVGGRRSLYNATGIQIMPFNTVFQLNAERGETDSLLDKSARLLFTPDLINYLLCGECANEATIASTSQLIDIRTRDWSETLLTQLNIPRHLLTTPVQPGQILGKIRNVPGLENVPLCTVGSHDTASAVASVPAGWGEASRRTSWGYIATGTWALIGAEIDTPIISDLSYDYNWTHEGAVNGAFRFLRNCTGMWMIQELRRAWADPATAQLPDYDTLMREAQSAAPFKFLIDPDYPEFAAPGEMPRKVADFCRRTGQNIPQTRGEFYRAVMEGIVMRYREVWGELEQLTGVRREAVNIIGGAIKDEMHCRMTADALATPLECGPVEGASMGNAIAQMVASGDLKSFAEGRALVAASVDVKRWEPENPGVWDAPFAAWQQMKSRG